MSNSSWSDTVRNENTSRNIITFYFQTIIAFYIFGIHFYFWMLFSTFEFFFRLFYNYTVFNICIFLTVFQRFDKLAFSLCQRALCSLQKIVQYRINKITTYRCCHQEVFRQIVFDHSPKNCKTLEKTFLKNIFERCSFIFTGKMKLIEFLHK